MICNSCIAALVEAKDKIMMLKISISLHILFKISFLWKFVIAVKDEMIHTYHRIYIYFLIFKITQDNKTCQSFLEIGEICL